MEPSTSDHVPVTDTWYVSSGCTAKPLGFHLSFAFTVNVLVGLDPDGTVPVHFPEVTFRGMVPPRAERPPEADTKEAKRAWARSKAPEEEEDTPWETRLA